MSIQVVQAASAIQGAESGQLCLSATWHQGPYPCGAGVRSDSSVQAIRHPLL